MAVPKRKTSKAKRNSRSSANLNIKMPAITECPHCHETTTSHTVCKSCGYYDGEQIIQIKTKK